MIIYQHQNGIKIIIHAPMIFGNLNWCSRRLGVNFTHVLRAAFTRADPKSAIKLLNLTVFFALLGSARVKAARRTLVKLTPGLPHLIVPVRVLSFLLRWKKDPRPEVLQVKIQARTVKEVKLFRGLLRLNWKKMSKDYSLRLNFECWELKATLGFLEWNK